MKVINFVLLLLFTINVNAGIIRFNIHELKVDSVVQTKLIYSKIRSDKKIVNVFLELNSDTTSFIRVICELPSGISDSNFGEKGLVRIKVAQIDESHFSSALLFQNDKLLIGIGKNVGMMKSICFFTLLNQNGNIDSSFKRKEMTLSSTKNIVFSTYGRNHFILGLQSFAADHDVGLICFDLNGNLDSTFENNGLFSCDIDNSEDVIDSIYFISRKKLLVLGHSYDMSGNIFYFELLICNDNNKGKRIIYNR